MAEPDSVTRALVDAIDEPALIVERGIVRLANARAHELLGNRIEGRDVRLAIRHPQALEHIHRPARRDRCHRNRRDRAARGG